MKTVILKLAAIMLIITAGAYSCEKDKEPTLPPETQDGKDTFGCYINDSLFVRKGRYKNPYAVYLRDTKTLHFGCTFGTIPKMLLYIENPRESEYNFVSGYIDSYRKNGYNGCWNFIAENTGQVFITKFDTINRIVSGTFEFSAKCASSFYSPEGPIIYSGDSTVHVSNGRFDIKLDIYDSYE